MSPHARRWLAVAAAIAALAPAPARAGFADDAVSFVRSAAAEAVEA